MPRPHSWEATSNDYGASESLSDSYNHSHIRIDVNNLPQSQPKGFIQSFRRTNALFWPLIAFTFLALLFLILTIVGFSRSTSSHDSSPPIALPQSRMIGNPMLLPESPSLYRQFSILQMNDVYEMMPLQENTRGGLARVAYIRDLLKTENENTLMVLAGDFLSPSALSAAQYNGSMLSGRQMVAVLNSMQLDYVVFGNHEFDLNQRTLLQRIDESTFQWLSCNTFVNQSNTQLFPTNAINPGFVIRTINDVRMLMIGVTIDENEGSGRYVNIRSVDQSIAIVQSIVTAQAGNYDVAVALTHWTIDDDALLAEAVPQLSLIMGGHEHANSYWARGVGLIPIAKADSNDATVFIHRFAYRPDTKQLLISSHLQLVDQTIPSDPVVNAVVNVWWQRGIQGFEAQGFKPFDLVTTLPPNVIWDGRSQIVRTQRDNPLTQAICTSIQRMTLNQSTSQPIEAAIFNTGSVRIDDLLMNEIVQYDVLRVLPFENQNVLLNVSLSIVAAALYSTNNSPGSGGFLQFCGKISLNGSTYFWNNVPLLDLNQTVLLATSDYLSPGGAGSIFDGAAIVETGKLMSQDFIQYLNTTQPTINLDE